MKDATTILELTLRIEEILKANEVAGQNPKALEDLRVLAAQMPGHCHYCGEKAAMLAAFAESFYSLDADELHPRGAVGLHEEMDDLLHRIRSWALMWGRNGA